MYEATVVLIPKPEKDKSECVSHRPISLLNIGYNILAKILVRRLSRQILSIINSDQTGFMPGGSTSHNISRTQ